MGGEVLVESHYGRGRILDSILAALRGMGKDPERLSPVDLAPVDEFHIRGREATIELAKRAAPARGLRVLDVGCGLGGSARFLAQEYACRVTGVDLTREYVDAAGDLAVRVGLADKVEFRQASALALPFAAGEFDLVWTEHVQMNIADKGAFYAELARVLKRGGRLVYHDIFAGAGGPVHFPVPWAETPDISFLAAPGEAQAHLEALGLRFLERADRSAQATAWFEATLERLGQSGPPPLGLHLLMGPSAPVKFGNMLRNLKEGRIAVWQAVAEKPSQA
jgi:ubiquinone/menaquinone biosynthesis C-methylase UbiE